MTLCLSWIKLHFAHSQSRYLQVRLWPLSQEMTPWFLHLAHFGLRSESSLSRLFILSSQIFSQFEIFLSLSVKIFFVVSLSNDQLRWTETKLKTLEIQLRVCPQFQGSLSCWQIGYVILSPLDDTSEVSAENCRSFPCWPMRGKDLITWCGASQ